MLKVNEFEYAKDEWDRDGKGGEWTTSFSLRQNDWYNYTSSEDLLNNLDDLKAMVKDFIEHQVPRLSILATYASGMNYGISRRPNRVENGKSDKRARHNFGGFIATFNTGYLFGVPVKVESEDEDERDEILRINKINNVDRLNSELAYDCSRFGRAYELHYYNSNGEERIAISSAFDTFVIYGTDIEHKPIAAVRLVKVKKGDTTHVVTYLYTEDKVYTFKSVDLSVFDLVLANEEDHYYGQVPVIEWQNNRFRQGDYEAVISQIDLYDQAQSDTGNYMSDLNEAMLVLKGSIADSDLTGDDIKKMKDANILLLESSIGSDGKQRQMDAGYIYKQYDVAGTEAYKKRLQEDIHKFSYTPDFTDKEFGTSSGIALRYKLIGTEQNRATKESKFTEAIKQRYNLINSLHQNIKGQTINAKELEVKFTENIPTDYWTDIQQFMQSGGELSQQTLIGLLPWVSDYDTEQERINLEINPLRQDIERVENE